VLHLVVNGQSVEVDAPAGAMLLDVLRDGLRLTGTKAGCRRGECGACTVLMGGRPIMACMQLAGLVEGPIVTVEGLGADADRLAAAFADCGAFQCGFCTSGQMVHAWSLIRDGLPSDPDAAEIFVRQALSGNICRCTGYAGIVQAVLRAAGVRTDAEAAA
jgi:aerobic-type carbon monoxide dehydrogenase small subunit (CoxS/CutS family)